jgi:CheY-like chemotaxis protein
MRECVAGILEVFGFDVVAARSGREALDQLKHRPDLRLLFTDVRMPGMDGFELAKKASRLRPDIAIAFTTGFSATAPEPEYKLLRKPYRAHELLAFIRDVLGA